MTLREIHSLKLTAARRYSGASKFGLVMVSALLTAIGFVGVGDIAHDLGIDEGPVEFAFNVLLLILLALVIQDLAWRHADHAVEHQRAIVVLTGFIRGIEDKLALEDEAALRAAVPEVHARHGLIIEILPAHTDRDYLKAKRATSKKDVKKAAIEAKRKKELAKAS